MPDENTDRDDLNTDTTDESTEDTSTDTTEDTTDTSETDTTEDTTSDTDTSSDDKEAQAELERARKALRKANKEAEERRHKLKEWEELGVDPSKMKELLEEQRKAERKRKEDEGRYQELMEEMENNTAEEIRKAREEADEKVNKMQKNLEKHFIDKTVTEAIAAEGGSAKLLSRHIKDQVKVVESDDGEFETVVLDDKGEVRTKRGGANFTVSDLLNEMKKDDDFARAFPAPDVSGNGSDPSSTGKGSPSDKEPPANTKRRSEMSIEERAAFRAQYGAEKYNKLPF